MVIWQIDQIRFRKQRIEFSGQVSGVFSLGIDEPICMIVNSGEMETLYYYHYDKLGSVVALSNDSRVVIEQNSYDEFGNIAGSSSVGNPYFFTC